jgi:hypothetical protein
VFHGLICLVTIAFLFYGLYTGTIGIRFPAGAGKFSLRHRVQRGTGAHPAPYLMGTRGSSLEEKWPGREADYSPPSSAEFKECVELYLHSPKIFMACCVVKPTDNFALLPFQILFSKKIPRKLGYCCLCYSLVILKHMTLFLMKFYRKINSVVDTVIFKLFPSRSLGRASEVSRWQRLCVRS